MVAFSHLLNRRFSMVLLACIVVPFIVVTLSHFGYADATRATAVLDPLLKPNVQNPDPKQQPPQQQPPQQEHQQEQHQQAPPAPPPATIKQEWTPMEFTKDAKPTENNVEKPPAPPVQEQPPANQVAVSNNDIVAAVHNETLGFGATILISLKTRSDRQDAVSLIGSWQGIKITHVLDAVRGEDIHQKAYPYGIARTELPLPYLGSWRSHMNAFRYIVDNRIETALLLEDDVDWDIYVKEQMASFALGLRTSPLRKPLTQDEIERAPYGLDWDVMHLGTSKNVLAPKPYNNLYHRYNDQHSTPRKLINRDTPCGDRDFFCWNDIIKQTGTADDQRVIFPGYQPVGLVAIAVSFKGAQKMLYDLSWKSLDTSMDFGVRDGCQRGFLKCWSVTPPIMSSWRVGGAGDSDLRNGGKGSPGQGNNMQGESLGLGWSARKHMQQQFDVHNYWKDGTIGWYSQEKPPIPDEKYGRISGKPPGESEMPSRQNEQPVPVRGEEKPNIAAAPQHEEPPKEQQPPAASTQEQEPHQHVPQPMGAGNTEPAPATEHHDLPGAEGHFRPTGDDDPTKEPANKDQQHEPANHHEEPDEENEVHIAQQVQSSTAKPTATKTPGEDDTFAKKDKR